jgi:hypothetical protein
MPRPAGSAVPCEGGVNGFHSLRFGSPRLGDDSLGREPLLPVFPGRSDRMFPGAGRELLLFGGVNGRKPGYVREDGAFTPLRAPALFPSRPEFGVLAAFSRLPPGVPALGFCMFPLGEVPPGEFRDSTDAGPFVLPPAWSGVKCPSCFMDCCRREVW